MTKGYENENIYCQVVNTEGKGETLKFQSSLNISKVVKTFIGNNKTTNTRPYPANTKQGFLYLESPAYKAGQKNGYTLNFYVLNKLTPIWTITVSPKKFILGY